MSTEDFARAAVASTMNLISEDISHLRGLSESSREELRRAGLQTEEIEEAVLDGYRILNQAAETLNDPAALRRIDSNRAEALLKTIREMERQIKSDVKALVVVSAALRHINDLNAKLSKILA